MGQSVRALYELIENATQGAFAGRTAMTLADPEVGNVERLRKLAQRCRDLSDMTMVPEVARELAAIAAELDGEAERAGRR
jgi:hypothetical protein